MFVTRPRTNADLAYKFKMTTVISRYILYICIYKKTFPKVSIYVCTIRSNEKIYAGC